MLSPVYLHVHYKQQETGTNPLVGTCSTFTQPRTRSLLSWYVSHAKTANCLNNKMTGACVHLRHKLAVCFSLIKAADVFGQALIV